jgi:tripartite-type tricarboxylate transporter receptor subunit TctC
VRSGKLRALGVMSAVETWYGIFAPAGTASPVVARINADLNFLLKEPAIRSAVENQGMAVAGGPPERLGELLGRELARWKRVVDAAGIKAD